MAITRLAHRQWRHAFYSTEKFRVGLVQMSCALDPNENLEKAIWRTREAAGRGAQIVCLPGAVSLAIFLPRRKRRAVRIWRSRFPDPPRRRSAAWRASSGS